MFGSSLGLPVSLEKREMSGKGGARHTPKPQLDAGVLQTMFGKHQDVIKDLGKYERISKKPSK